MERREEVKGRKKGREGRGRREKGVPTPQGGERREVRGGERGKGGEEGGEGRMKVGRGGKEACSAAPRRFD